MQRQVLTKKWIKCYVYPISCEDWELYTLDKLEVILSKKLMNISKAEKFWFLFSNHLLDNNHKCNPRENFSLAKSYKCNSKEILEINEALKRNKNLVNSQVNFNSSPLWPRL